MKELPITVHLAIHNSEKEEGGTIGRTDGARERGRGVGGQRLKLHHKSHPERKHEVNPPPSLFHPPLPLWPGPLLSLLRPPPLPLFLCTESAPWMDQVYFISLLHVLQTPNSPISPQPLLFSSTSPPFLFPTSTSLLQGYKSLSRPDRQRRRKGS